MIINYVTYFMLLFIILGCQKKLDIFENKLIIKTQNNGNIIWEDRYLLSLKKDKKNNKLYTVTLAFNFTSTDDDSKKYEKIIMENIQSCLKRVNPFFLEPNNEKMNIEVKNEKVADLDPINVNLVKKTRVRSPYNTFSLNYNCPTLLHEIIHFLGIEDEYPVNGLRCRATGPDDSLFMKMNRSFRATGILLTFDDYLKYVRENCEWSSSKSKRCIAYKKRYKKIISQNLNLNDNIKKEIVESFNTSSDPIKKRKSLLLPRQFEAIVFNAKKHRGAMLYRKCTKYASDSSCSFLPKECKSKDWLTKKL